VESLFADLAGVQVRAGSLDNHLVVQLPGLANQIEQRIAAVLTGHDFEVLKVDAVGPKVGKDLRVQAFIALSATIVLVLIYIAFRFDLTFAPGAILALIHDVSIVSGAFVLVQKEFSLSIIGALLTILGYSLNDTVVIYDRMRENREKFPRMPLPELINKTMNEMLGRTLTTAGATGLAIGPFLLFGGPVVGDFAFAMLLGFVFGAYSTIYVATPFIMVMEEVKPHLTRWMVAAPAGAPTAASPAGEDAPERPLTESEKRRRERAQRERAERSTGEPG
jgi:preprotein translocase subunit SecF